VVAAALGAVAATALTPAGPIGVLYPLRYVSGGTWWLTYVQEWQSPDFHEPTNLALMAIVVMLALNGGRASPGWLNLVSIVGVVMALLAVRNSAVAAVFAVPPLALGLEDRLRTWRGPRRAARSDAQIRRRAMEAMLTVVVVVGTLAITVPRAPRIEPDAERFPVAGVDVLRNELPDARVFAEYGWAGYVIAELHPTGGLVFIDGRADMYAESIMFTYSDVRAALGDWRDELDRYGVDAILLPPAAPLVHAAAEEAGWCRAHADAQSVLLLRVCRGS
jgi:hypothetical protein